MTRNKKTLTSRLNEAAGNRTQKVEPSPEPAPAPKESGGKPKRSPSRQGTKTICVHVAPEVQKGIRLIAAEEDVSIQKLMEEALNMLFANRGKPPIA